MRPKLKKKFYGKLFIDRSINRSIQFQCRYHLIIMIFKSSSVVARSVVPVDKFGQNIKDSHNYFFDLSKSWKLKKNWDKNE